MAGLGDKIYKLYKEAHEWDIKLHGKSEQNELGISKLATPREISLLVIKEAGGGARNNIQVLNPLDYVTCLVNDTLHADVTKRNPRWGFGFWIYCR
ncbi:putative uncharacterized protein C12orf77 homolog [Myotis lucifugus]|uniref:putative uncharacterized protein C12orf77 homolog n=1 Tax=Myotis lucifugus TaxID=59463 RepID=UPI0006D721F0|nr:putative uncharacterized protein C12orf77 homolog [Myotis lucifugus]